MSQEISFGTVWFLLWCAELYCSVGCLFLHFGVYGCFVSSMPLAFYSIKKKKKKNWDLHLGVLEIMKREANDVGDFQQGPEMGISGLLV